MLFVMLRLLRALGEQRQQCQAIATGSAALNNNFFCHIGKRGEVIFSFLSTKNMVKVQLSLKNIEVPVTRW